MADPNVPTLAGDIRYEDRSGCFVLVDPERLDGPRDVATAWEETPDRWRWRMGDRRSNGEPHPTADSRDGALRAMLEAYARTDRTVGVRLAEQRPRFSFGEPQIHRR